MNHKETFEDEGFVYELTVKASAGNRENLHMHSPGTRYSCQWTIREKQKQLTREIAVTDDECEVIIYSSVEAAVRGARDFLSI